MKRLLRRLNGFGERANRQFVKHPTLRMLRALCLVAAAVNVIAVLLLIGAAVLVGPTWPSLLGLAGIALLAFAVQGMVLGGVLVLWWLNYTKEAADAELRLSIDELPGTLEQTMRRASRPRRTATEADVARAHLRRRLFAEQDARRPHRPDSARQTPGADASTTDSPTGDLPAADGPDGTAA